MSSIPLRGVRVHNLRDIDVDIPLGRLTVVTGVSGAGKSSLVFDTLHAEAQRRYLQSFSASIRQHLERLERPDADFIGDLPPAIALGQAALPLGPHATVGAITEVTDLLARLFARAGTPHCTACGQPVQAATAADVLAAVDALPPGARVFVGFPAPPATDPAALREEGFVRVFVNGAVQRLDQDGPLDLAQAVVLVDRLEAGKQALPRLRESIDVAFARGQGRLLLVLDNEERSFDRRLRCPACDLLYAPLSPALFDVHHPQGVCPTCQGTGRSKNHAACPTCAGLGLNAQALAVRLAGLSFAECLTMPMSELRRHINEMRPVPEAAAEQRLLLHEVHHRLGCLERLCLGYLTLHRPAATVSSAELKRARLAAAIGANLVQTLFLIDEPTTGLHARDVPALIAELNRLRDAGNTLVVIEHDRDVIRAADQVIDLGPGAGEEGGRLLYQGPPEGLPTSRTGSAPGVKVESLTASYLRGEESAGIPEKRRTPRHFLSLRGARTHNLRDVTVDFPLGVLCVVTGVSGAGKRSLVEHTLYPALKGAKKKADAYDALVGASHVSDVVLIDQTPLQRSARSNPATFLKIFDDIRDLFAQTTDAKIRNLGPGAFSFNQPGGRCEACAGQGVLTVDMHFLADVVAACPECRGARFTPEVLKIRVRNLNIAEVLDLTAREAFRFFRAQPAIEKRLKLLLDVGLDYLRLGQATTTLSGGECQRLKLAGQLASTRKARCLFILLEPTYGLHPADVANLLDCFNRLLDTGHSLLIVEHDLDVIQNADYLIDLGPEAGPAGGRVSAVGTPEDVALVGESPTGQCLRPLGSRR